MGHGDVGMCYIVMTWMDGWMDGCMDGWMDVYYNDNPGLDEFGDIFGEHVRMKTSFKSNRFGIEHGTSYLHDRCV